MPTRKVANLARRLWMKAPTRASLSWLAWIGAAIVLAWGAAGLVTSGRTEAQLVRGDPDAIPAQAPLMRFAVTHGAGVFKARCASCHGAEGKGSSARGVPDLTDADWLYGAGKVSDIEKVAYYGIRAHNPRSWNLAVMPAFARPVPAAGERLQPLGPGEIAAVTAYLQARGGQAADPAAAEAGRRIFAGKGGCYDCHANDARGDPAIGAPNLVDKVWLYGDGSRLAIFDSIAYGRQGMCPAWAGRLSALRLREVSLYVFALSHRPGPHPDMSRP
ncbi:MAG TPA: c-type cytochrome [Phenylobacterium sp.]|jgi:cytochrome c oxidase cbb3-type subunit 3|uniref:c-type cytochrome n=1 Tax=Phenylobacterium sp. TaxID=1871053 RepID=UPI002B9AD18B|nr:c-type cytochrome [Phenylobacterium sp.]HXA40554.1 c-type cytochrome [Phenylobacterium sp.]